MSSAADLPSTSANAACAIRPWTDRTNVLGSELLAFLRSRTTKVTSGRRGSGSRGHNAEMDTSSAFSDVRTASTIALNSPGSSENRCQDNQPRVTASGASR